MDGIKEIRCDPEAGIPVHCEKVVIDAMHMQIQIQISGQNAATTSPHTISLTRSHEKPLQKLPKQKKRKIAHTILHKCTQKTSQKHTKNTHKHKRHTERTHTHKPPKQNSQAPRRSGNQKDSLRLSLFFFVSLFIFDESGRENY